MPSPSLARVVCWLPHLEKIWREPDNGIWEIRGEHQHFTHSKVMSWLAFQRASDSRHLGKAERFRSRWRQLAARIHGDICRHGVDARGGHFVQAYGSHRLDAALLLLAIVGFLPARDQRIRNTVAAIEKHLIFDGLVLRYETDTRLDGLLTTLACCQRNMTPARAASSAISPRPFPMSRL